MNRIATSCLPPFARIAQLHTKSNDDLSGSPHPLGSRVHYTPARPASPLAHSRPVVHSADRYPHSPHRGARSDKGTVRIALDNEQNYDVDGNVRAGSLSIQDGVARWTVEDVPHGTYAVRVHHDANGNGKMDTSMFGIPQEAFGFSNNAQGTFGPPAFEEAAFTLAADSLSMTIRTE